MDRAIRRVGIAVIVLILVLVAQLTYLQVIDADRLADDPRNTRAALRDANRPRGPIVTADGVVVASSIEVDDGTDFKYQRQYPDGPLFSQVVGYQSFVIGNSGVEKTYNDALVGRDAELQLQNLPDLVSGTDGTGTVVLSLRADLQRAAAEGLGFQRGSVVALDVRTGAVLAMYSNPAYDNQPLASHDTKAVQDYYRDLVSNPDKPDLPRAYREVYPPGSTFKAVTASVAIENGVSTPDAPAYPVLRELDLPQTDNTLKNFGGQSCGGTLAQSFTVSCNTTFGQIGLDLGDAFVPGMNRFGLGAVPPLDVAPGAVASIGPRPGSFAENQPLFAFAGVGQGDVAATPLQMAMVAAGIANGGVLMKAHVAAEIRDGTGDLVRRIASGEWRTAVSPGTAQAVAAMMVSVVQSPQGTGTAARIPGVTVAGKTGTAQADGGDPHAWFIGFAPAEAPEVAVAVIVERGGSIGSEATGGRVAAPIAARVLRTALGL
ncbi:MAG TPA: penicillin-binding transpeptidase domain-containing protein [Acidimicrobiia bacterium]|nr:penicillin-binding transpeptidase domain-containing protein [Acidimicrobiia bacterium]